MRTAVPVIAGLAVILGVGSAYATPTIAYSNSVTPHVQDYGHDLGLDFNVVSPVNITALGAFDNGVIANLKGHDGSSGVTVAIFDRSTQLQVGSSVHFALATPGTQTAADAFLPVSFSLPVGNYSVVAFNDINYNTGGNPGPSNQYSIEHTGGSLISFVGTGRFSGASALAYPTALDHGPSNRYNAGTFQFEAPPSAVPEPATLALLGVGLLGLGIIRYKRV